ncbi:MAG: 5'-methylthioadenosine/adenosylhomocysteine nucleosidase [Oscillospiraceae bacterium]|nr:5'-methylthioadenosine/adenosylhomocysteine nucleosidase [Oscillospiraceae bacterium]
MRGPIGVIGAMEPEVALLMARMEGKNETVVGHTVYAAGKLGGQTVVVSRCGIGKVCAAICVQTMVERFDVSAVINTGIAGGLHPELAVGDIVAAADTLQHDFDLGAWGYARGHIPYIGGHGPGDEPTRFPVDPEWTERYIQAAQGILPPGHKIIRGTIVSGDIFVDDADLKRRLISDFGAAAVEMEGAAVGQAAAANRVPYAVFRAISDLAEKGPHINFRQFEQEMGELSAEIVIKMFTELL